MAGPESGPPAGMRQSMLLYPPGGNPSLGSQYKDFHSGLSMGMPPQQPTDLGHPGRGPPGMSAGWQHTDQEFAQMDANHTLDHMKAFQDLEQSERNLELQRKRYNAIETQKNQARAKVEAKWQPSSNTKSAFLLVAIGLLALLLIDAFRRMQ